MIDTAKKNKNQKSETNQSNGSNNLTRNCITVHINSIGGSSPIFKNQKICFFIINFLLGFFP